MNIPILLSHNLTHIFMKKFILFFRCMAMIQLECNPCLIICHLINTMYLRSIQLVIIQTAQIHMSRILKVMKVFRAARNENCIATAFQLNHIKAQLDLSSNRSSSSRSICSIIGSCCDNFLIYIVQTTDIKILPIYKFICFNKKFSILEPIHIN